MKTSHLTAWEQEEYLINQRSPQLLRHLSECSECRDKVAHLEQGLGMYRRAAVAWSAQSLASRPDTTLLARRIPIFRWAFAAIVPLLVLALLLLPLHWNHSDPVRPTPQMSDDALLEQVDEQLSVAVPSSMESLTHLVSTQGGSVGSATSARGSKPIVQTN